jgi:Holliday junction resolvase RusA-like endonuclease
MQILLEFNGIEIPSVNSIYLPRKGGGKYLSRQASEFKNVLQRQLGVLNPEVIENLKAIPLYHLHIEYVMKKSYGRRDLDNLNKLVQDGIFQFLGVNDSRVVSLNIEKYNRSGGSYEFIIVKLTPSKIDINKYN